MFMWYILHTYMYDVSYVTKQYTTRVTSIIRPLNFRFDAIARIRIRSNSGAGFNDL